MLAAYQARACGLSCMGADDGSTTLGRTGLTTRKRSDQTGVSARPLSLDQLAEGTVRVAQHAPVVKPLRSARFELEGVSNLEPPAVTTSLSRVRVGRQWRWRVDVSVDGGEVQPSTSQV